MTTIIVSEDCGNSPKNIFLQNLAIAFAKGDMQFILSSVTDDVRWQIVGERLFQGKAEFAKALANMENASVEEINIQHVVTHGKARAVNGIKTQKDGKIIAFCEVVEFNGAKATHVKEITSYGIEITRTQTIE
jgi:hypothetical protein